MVALSNMCTCLCSFTDQHMTVQDTDESSEEEEEESEEEEAEEEPREWTLVRTLASKELGFDVRQSGTCAQTVY